MALAAVLAMAKSSSDKLAMLAPMPKVSNVSFATITSLAAA